LDEIQARLPVIFPAHPRTIKRIGKSGFESRVNEMLALKVVEPLGYLEFLNLMAKARLVLTDSGGIQEEITILDIPSLALRENTERPVTLTKGTNVLVGRDPEKIICGAFNALQYGIKTSNMLELWDGRTGERIMNVLLAEIE
jgi:UDP-N-acetylglucosamine 2-epimerase (non-hydrolysing)